MPYLFITDRNKFYVEKTEEYFYHIISPRMRVKRFENLLIYCYFN